MTTKAEVRRTPLYEEHMAAKAKLVPFAGYEMPIQYASGITAEHTAVRSGAGLFDASHMGEFDIRGPGALDLVQYVTTNDASTLEVGQAQYSILPDENGALLDDLIVYKLADQHYMLVVNASNRAKGFEWISRFTPRFEASLTDRSDEISLLALQGPAAQMVLSRLTEMPLEEIGYYRFEQGAVNGVEALVSRTGYTGEDGFELYISNEAAAPLWRAILEAGAPEGTIPAGLGARDSLRLEMGYPLYGNDLDETRNPFEAGLAWITKLNKGPFTAFEALRDVKVRGVSEKLVGFRLLERGFPRSGYDIARDGQVVGRVTSGTLSPSLGVGIGMGYVATAVAAAGTPIDIMIRGQAVPAEIVKPPFYTDGSLRR